MKALAFFCADYSTSADKVLHHYAYGICEFDLSLDLDGQLPLPNNTTAIKVTCFNVIKVVEE